MEVFTMVVLIVAIYCGASVINNYLKTQRSERKRSPDDDILAELETLRKRVEVLEEIVTDDRYHLSKELDRLERQA